MTFRQKLLVYGAAGIIAGAGLVTARNKTDLSTPASSYPEVIDNSNDKKEKARIQRQLTILRPVSDDQRVIITDGEKSNNGTRNINSSEIDNNNNNNKISNNNISKPLSASDIHTRVSCKFEFCFRESLPISVQASKGLRSYMEDDYCISGDGRFAAVYDGHGGAVISKFLKENLFQYFLKALPDEKSYSDPNAIKKALQFAFSESDKTVLQYKSLGYQGSTAVAVVLCCDPVGKKAWLISANVGDSRAVLCRKGIAIDLTEDHKPNAPVERERVEKLGGNVRWYGYNDPDGNPIEGTGVYRINGNLAVSRAIGDLSERPYVSGEAELREFDMEEGDQFLILATDGLWDVMSSDQVVNFVNGVMSGSLGALREGGDDLNIEERPVDKSITNWAHEFENDRGMIRAAIKNRKKRMSRYLIEEAFRRGSSDNVTVAVVWLDA